MSERVTRSLTHRCSQEIATEQTAPRDDIQSAQSQLSNKTESNLEQSPNYIDTVLRWPEPTNSTFVDVLGCKSTLEVKHNFIAWLNGELKPLFGVDEEHMQRIVPLYSLPNRIARWTVENVHTFLTGVGYPQMAECMRQHEIDGMALLLLSRNDILYGCGLKEGSACRLWALLYRMHQRLDDVFEID